jgi:hypothetical protein
MQEVSLKNLKIVMNRRKRVRTTDTNFSNTFNHFLINYFGGLFKESLIPLDLEVESNYAIGKGPPRVDLLIIRKENTNWTESQLKYLPDGVRQSKRRHIIMELKKTQSI